MEDGQSGMYLVPSDSVLESRATPPRSLSLVYFRGVELGEKYVNIFTGMLYWF